MGSPLEQNFRPTWESLLSFALRKGVSFQDAEDLVSATIQVALDRFSGERGKFLPFCITVLNNKIKNHWRDQKTHEPFEEDESPGDEQPLLLEEEEERARMRKMLERIRKHLTSEETEFMSALGSVLEELESRAVSEAARSLGLAPEKGWDLFRRIQRKAKSLYPALKVEEGPSAPAQAAPAPAADAAAFEAIVHYRSAAPSKKMRAIEPPLPSLLTLARAEAHDAGFGRMVGSLNGEQATRLGKIFRS
jgi:DNA-directed RNA polymerase specialized sigma24 family protein